MSGERQWQWQQQRQVCIVCHSACRPEHAVIALCVCDAKEGAFEGERERGSLTCTHISFCTLYPNLPLLAAFQSASTVCRSAAGIVGTSAGRAAHRHQNSSSSGGGNTQHGGRLSAQEEDAADTALQQWPATRATHSKDTVLVFWGGGECRGCRQVCRYHCLTNTPGHQASSTRSKTDTWTPGFLYWDSVLCLQSRKPTFPQAQRTHL